MSPAGYWPQLQAAIEAGADAVYFGLTHFTARAKVGFPVEELPAAIRTLHQRGVKGFITFNTLIFENELPEAARTIAEIADSGADAIIVQDPAILKLARQIAPQLELHASTQMSITDAAGVEFARSLGAARVTLARELSLADIAAIRRATACDLEIFVHGALCVAYSGQCFSSEAWAAAPTAASAHKHAACLTNSSSTIMCSRWQIRAISFHPAIYAPWSTSRKSSSLASRHSRSRGAIKMPTTLPSQRGPIAKPLMPHLIINHHP